MLVAGGARGLTGAPCLSSMAAMRAGAGYVTACVPDSLNDIFEIKLTEVMSAPLPDDGGSHTAAGAGEVLERAAARGGAVVLGPGLGRSEGAFAFARAVALGVDGPLVLDADGLNAFAGDLEALAARGAPTILTPHAGELGRLLDLDSDAIAAARLDHARDAARRSGAIVVLKGDDTLVAEPDGRVGISRGGVAGAGHCRHRRRPLRHPRRLPGPRDGTVRGSLRRRLHARGGWPPCGDRAGRPGWRHRL